MSASLVPLCHIAPHHYHYQFHDRGFYLLLKCPQTSFSPKSRQAPINEITRFHCCLCLSTVGSLCNLGDLLGVPHMCSSPGWPVRVDAVSHQAFSLPHPVCSLMPACLVRMLLTMPRVLSQSTPKGPHCPPSILSALEH